MKIEITKEQAAELLRALEAHIKRLNGFIFSTPNPGAQSEFEERRRLVEDVAAQIREKTNEKC